MTYNKPEITVLGEANFVIHGNKANPPEGTNPVPPGTPSFELED